MRVHQNQTAQNAQLDAVYAAQKAEAKRVAERTREKLLKSASKLASEAEGEACVVKLGPREGSQHNGSQEETMQPRPKEPHNSKTQPDTDHSANLENSISDWV